MVTLTMSKATWDQIVRLLNLHEPRLMKEIQKRIRQL
jgi:hypothetical protein